MKRNLILIFLLFHSIVLLAQDRALVISGTPKEKRLALVIGNGDYPVPNGLGEQPKNDAKDMAAALKELGFDVDSVLINAGKAQIDKAVRNFSSNLARYDVGLIFYAGHGIALDGINYIIPIDFPENPTKADMPYVATDIDWIQGKMRDAGSENKTNIIIVDACRDAGNVLRSYGMGGTGRSFGDDGSNWVPPKNLPTGVITCFAASNGQKADNNAGQRNGLYTGTLLKHIKTPNLLITQVFSRVRADLLKSKGQEPEEHNKLTKDFYFNPRQVSETNVEVNKDIKDSDGDGIVDRLDKCPFQYGELKNEGCPFIIESKIDDALTKEWYLKGENFYYGSNGVTQDYTEAMKWFRKAADQGYASAQNNLGFMYEYGYGVSADHAEAVKWYRKAADQHDASAQYNLGNMYFSGYGVPKDDEEAVKWYRKAADQGYASAQGDLGFMYEYGYGVPEDDEKAVKWYRKAADQGDATAQNDLGDMYFDGYGVPKDDEEAVKWYRKAADHDYATAQNNL